MKYGISDTSQTSALSPAHAVQGVRLSMWNRCGRVIFVHESKFAWVAWLPIHGLNRTPASIVQNAKLSICLQHWNNAGQFALIYFCLSGFMLQCCKICRFYEIIQHYCYFEANDGMKKALCCMISHFLKILQHRSESMLYFFWIFWDFTTLPCFHGDWSLEDVHNVVKYYDFENFYNIKHHSRQTSLDFS